MDDSKKAVYLATPDGKRAKLRWRQVALLLVVFVAGGITGAVVATSMVNSRLQHYRNHPKELPDKIVPMLKRRLDLSESQTKQIDSLFRTHHSRIVELRRQSGPQLHAEFDLMVETISRVLDAEQAAIWRAISRNVRIRFLPKNPDD